MIYDIESLIIERSHGINLAFTPCHKCGWKIDSEKYTKTVNPYNGSRKEYHLWCYDA